MLADSGVECCMLSVQFDIAFYIRCYVIPHMCEEFYYQNESY